MKKIDFYEIPIYRCTRTHFNLELKKSKENLEKELISIKIDFPELFEKSVRDIMNVNSYLYDYNEIIGWINLFVFGNQIRGEYYFEKELKNRNKVKRKFNKTIRKKRFDLIGKAFGEITVSNNFSNTEYSKKLIKRLEEINQYDYLLKNRFIDLEKFRNIIDFIDWNTLTKKSRCN